MNNPLPEGATLIKEVQFTQVAGRHKGKPRPTGWLIYEYEGNKIYRYDINALIHNQPCSQGAVQSAGNQ